MARFHFFRAGGVDQVSIRDADDLRALKDLDQKLWVALAMPTTGVDLDPATLDILDSDKDKRVRVHEILEAVSWLDATFKDPAIVLASAEDVELSAIKDAMIVAAAKRMLADLGKPSSTTISVADVTATSAAFANTKLNGDGIVTPASTDDAELAAAIDLAITAGGSTPDRSGKPGIDKARADAFFAAVDARAAWLAGEVTTLGDGTAAAADALAAVRVKIDDYFTRVRIAAYDKRFSSDVDLEPLVNRSLSATDDELARLPLARIDAALPLGAGLNPAWAARMGAFAINCVTPIIGARETLTEADLAAIITKLAPFDAWRAGKPTTIADSLDAAKVKELAKSDVRERIAKLIAADSALAPEYDGIASVTKAVRLRRDFGRVLRNFVNFSDFYAKQDGVFQAGTLYIDGRALHLCVPVADPAKHALLAAASDSYLAYFDVTRDGKTQPMAAALTNGDSENIFVGRNGVFYDRKGADWDATVTKIVSSPISIREAFWSPYKKLVKAIEEQVTKRAAAADAEATATMQQTGTNIAQADKIEVAPTKPAAKVDLGTVAAIGVAIGGIGTLVGALLSTLFGLGFWLPIGIVALFLMISGPAMLLAWLKLRRRNLGPILDANGWAVNIRARINVAFGAAMTELARLPRGASRSLDDPFADKKTPWRRWVILLVVTVLGASYYLGKLDPILPEPATSVHVLGPNAPAARK